ncbi:Pro-Pol polyprotein [Thelohanellus kitauei]|uniref:Pro-Pol polyprotein n=1 Tax=Thelohanellus kitauei TaxID=669202 RepID=A0A0C2J9M4_THEKT|nr:Pro-Pol polyprotein [Thelohanellus kitauei]
MGGGFSTYYQTIESTARLLVNKIVCRFGLPVSIHSDLGRQFDLTLFSQLCEILDIRKARSSPYHPKCNGMAERYVKTLKDKLLNMMLEQVAEWDELIYLALMTIRTAVHETTKCTPFQLLYGQMPRMINAADVSRRADNLN